MRVTVPHSLTREEVRQRLKDRAGGVADLFPDGMAEVIVSWPHEDRMALDVRVMGKAVAGAIEIEDAQVAVVLDLPASFAMFEPMVRGAIAQKSQKLLG